MKLERIDISIFIKKIIALYIVAVISAVLAANIDGGGLFFIPIILGLYLAFSNRDRFKINYLPFVMLPFLFFIIFITGGGLLILNRIFKFEMNSTLNMALIGFWCSQLIACVIMLFIRVRLYYYNLPIIGILVLPPYLLGLHPTAENENSIFLFYFLWQVGIAIGLSLLFSQKLRPKNIE